MHCSASCAQAAMPAQSPQSFVSGRVPLSDLETSDAAASSFARMLKCKLTSRNVELLCNPLNPRLGSCSAKMVTARTGAPRYDFSLAMGWMPSTCARILHQAVAPDEDTFYTIRLQPVDETVAGGETFCSKLVCSADGARYTFNDDPANYHYRGSELGAALIAGDDLVILLPRVQRDGSSAQFRVLTEQDSMISRFFSGLAREHMTMLTGPWAPSHGEEVMLAYRDMETHEQGDVLRAHEHDDELRVDFAAPLSVFQRACALVVRPCPSLCP